MLIDEREKLSAILRTITDQLDIPDYAYEDATLKYEDVGDHLSAEDSELKQYAPKVYVQGSFLLGTVVQPFVHDHGYDIDLVCKLEIQKDGITQKDLKEKIGRRLKSRDDLAKILSPSRRCWVLDYLAQADMPRFHMDVLPCIPNPESKLAAIFLTDTELTRWQKGNPIAYAEWFKKRMEVIFKVRKNAFAESIKASVDDVPDWRIKTPLQRSVQILKRHRDAYF